MARLPRSLLPDGIYHVTSRGVDGCPIYVDDDDRLQFLRLLTHVVSRWAWQMYALCLMTTHYHLVFETTRERLSAGMHRLNGRYAVRFNERHERRGHLFGDRFATRVIESDQYLVAACRYVVLNPVRAGLCADAADWPWSRSRFEVEETAAL